LGLTERSVIAVLFSETGLEHISYRRALLLLRNLKYLANLGEERLVKNGLLDSLNLARQHKMSRVNDVVIVLSGLAIPVYWKIHDHTLSLTSTFGAVYQAAFPREQYVGSPFDSGSHHCDQWLVSFDLCSRPKILSVELNIRTERRQTGGVAHDVHRLTIWIVSRIYVAGGARSIRASAIGRGNLFFQRLGVITGFPFLRTPMMPKDPGRNSHVHSPVPRNIPQDSTPSSLYPFLL
jgi:hypothetical protein